MKELRILQYNVNHGKEATLIPLLQDPRIKEFDILAIQEPWRNPFITTGYCPSNANFYLVYPPEHLARVSLYVNKRLHPDTWTVTYQSADAQTVTIRYDQDNGEGKTTIAIHNIYNPPGSYNSQEPGTLETLRKTLNDLTIKHEHVVLGDFNLHHSL
jgi:exonuclease III